MASLRTGLGALVCAVPLAVVAGCGAGDDGPGGDGGSALDQALAAVPADASPALFWHVGATAERLGVDGDTDAETYADAVGDDEIQSTPLLGYLELMAEAAFDERDVVWVVDGEVDDQPFTVLRLDGVDLDAFAEDLLTIDGFSEDDLRGRRDVSADPDDVVDEFNMIDDRYPFDFADVTIDADDDLLVVGAGADAVLAAVDGDRDSLADSDPLGDALDTDVAADAEFASLQAVARCGFTIDVAPEREAADAPLIAALGTPESAVYLVSGAPTLTARLRFADEAAAEADLAARTRYLAEGSLTSVAVPFADYFTADLAQDGAVVTVTLEPGERYLQLIDPETHEYIGRCAE